MFLSPVLPLASALLVLQIAPMFAQKGLLCPGDNSKSFCVMCEGSILRQQWDAGLKLIDQCQSDHPKSSQTRAAAVCYCKAYAMIAKAWSTGRCCSEFPPTLAAATNLCNLAEHPDSVIEARFQEFVGDAYRVQNTIWHNDKGTDVPKVFKFIEPFHGGSGEGYSGEVAQQYSQPKVNVSVASTLGESKISKKEPGHTTTQLHTTSDQYGAPTRTQASTGNSAENQKTSVVSNKTSAVSKKTSVASHPGRKHYHARITRNRSRDCVDDSKMYRSYADSLTTKESHSKRTLRLSRRANAVPLQENCGIDFQQVPYPKSIPLSVLKAFNEL